MGLANLVPGISGGTMLLAAGVYPRFVQAVAEVTTFKFRRASLVLLASVVGAALVAIVLLAGVVKGFVVDHRWVAYSLFIGLTLGGVPVVWALIRKPSQVVWAAAVVGFVAMSALALSQSAGASGAGAGQAGFALMFFAGVAGASAMILPGISGGYLLLVLGVYVAILTGISDVKDALKAGDFAAMMDPLLSVVLPVGLGVVVGVAVVSNLIRWLLDRYELATLGVLLGLLVGAVVGLWPFQQGVAPQVGDVIKGRVVTAESFAQLKPSDYPTAYFSPSGAQIGSAIGLVLLGFAATLGVARLGREPS
jgi:putative membrane protein